MFAEQYGNLYPSGGRGCDLQAWELRIRLQVSHCLLVMVVVVADGDDDTDGEWQKTRLFTAL